jgi:uncharacterized protein HemY
MERCGEERGYTCKDYIRCYDNSVKCGPDNAGAYEAIGFVLDVYFDDFGKAERAFRTAIELGAGHESYFGLARVLAQAGKEQDAIAWLSGIRSRR